MKFNYSFFTCLGPWICSSPYSDTCSMFWSLNVLFQPLFLYLLYVLVLEWVFPALILILVLCFSPLMCSSPYSDTCSMFWSLNVFQLLFWYLFYVLVLECVPALIRILGLFFGSWMCFSSPYFDTCSMFLSLNVIQLLFWYMCYVLVLECVFPALILMLVLCFSPWMCSSSYSDTCSMFWSLNAFQPLFWYVFYVLVLECVPALIFTLVLFLCSGLWICSNPFFWHLICGESSSPTFDYFCVRQFMQLCLFLPHSSSFVCLYISW